MFIVWAINELHTDTKILFTAGYGICLSMHPIMQLNINNIITTR